MLILTRETVRQRQYSLFADRLSPWFIASGAGKKILYLMIVYEFFKAAINAFC